jgi:hypothetical protein
MFLFGVDAVTAVAPLGLGGRGGVRIFSLVFSPIFLSSL